MTLLWKLLLAFFYLGAEGDDEDNEPQDAGEIDDGDEIPSHQRPDDEDEEPDGIDAMFDGATLEEAPPKTARREPDRAAQRKQEIADAAALAAAAAVRAAQPQQPQQYRDVQYDEEEEQLKAVRATGDQDQIARWEWWVRDNREKRNTNRMAQMAALRAQETDDKADFREVRDTHPKRYAAYKERVEKLHQDLMAKGSYVSRRILMRQLMGEDIDTGKVKMKTRTKADPQEARGPNVVRIDRGRSPTMRSDVSGKGQRTNLQKLEAKLAGKNI
jgi:hypothetical protein